MGFMCLPTYLSDKCPQIIGALYQNYNQPIGQQPKFKQFLQCNCIELMLNFLYNVLHFLRSSTGLGRGCQIYDRDYALLSKMSQLNAFNYTESQPKPSIIQCSQHSGTHQNFVQSEGLSIVSEVNEASIKKKTFLLSVCGSVCHIL